MFDDANEHTTFVKYPVRILYIVLFEEVNDET